MFTGGRRGDAKVNVEFEQEDERQSTHTATQQDW
jgi:hypothetical protein